MIPLKQINEKKVCIWLVLSHILHHCVNPKTHNKRKLYEVFNVVVFVQRQCVGGLLAETERHFVVFVQLQCVGGLLAETELHFTRPRASVTPE
jgi:hypothetical protein